MHQHPSRLALFVHADHGLPPQQEEEVAQHLEQCSGCSALCKNMQETVAWANDNAHTFESEAFVEAIVATVRRHQQSDNTQPLCNDAHTRAQRPGLEPHVYNRPEEKKTRSRRLGWLVAGAASSVAAAAAAAVLLHVSEEPSTAAATSHTGVTSSYVARRGEATDSHDRWVSIAVFKGQKDATAYEAVRRRISATDALTFAYRNRAMSRMEHVMILAVDAASRIYWYYPASAGGPTSATSTAAPPSEALVELPDEIRYPLKPGPLRIFGVFSEEPLRMADVEQVVKNTVSGTDIASLQRLPLPGTGQHSILVEVTE